MSDRMHSDAEEFLAALATGEISADEVEVRARLDANVELRARWEEIRATQAILVEEREEMERVLVDPDSVSDAEQARALDGFREQVRCTTGTPTRVGRSHGRGLRGLLLVAAVVLGFLAVKLWSPSGTTASLPGTNTYLEGDAFAEVSTDLDFGTLAWTRAGGLPTDRIALRAWALDDSGKRGELLFESEDVQSPVKVLPHGASPPGIEYELILHESNSPPRILIARQTR